MPGPITSSGKAFDQFSVPIDGTGDTPYEMLGLLVPKGSTVEAVFFDGTRRPVPVDADGLALYAGSREPVLGAMTITLADGTKLDCGPGTINGPSDVGSGDAVDAFDAPWNCLPA